MMLLGGEREDSRLSAATAFLAGDADKCWLLGSPRGITRDLGKTIAAGCRTLEEKIAAEAATSTNRLAEVRVMSAT